MSSLQCALNLFLATDTRDFTQSTSYSSFTELVYSWTSFDCFLRVVHETKRFYRLKLHGEFSRKQDRSSFATKRSRMKSTMDDKRWNCPFAVSLKLSRNSKRSTATRYGNLARKSETLRKFRSVRQIRLQKFRMKRYTRHGINCQSLRFNSTPAFAKSCHQWKGRCVSCWFPSRN